MSSIRYLFCMLLCIVSSHVPARAETGCVSFGDEAAQNTWLLCPKGVALEREYHYWGSWSDFYEIDTRYAPCMWNESLSAWQCSSLTIRCEEAQCFPDS